MRKLHIRLLPLMGLLFSTALALLGHTYVVYLPEYRVDALIFYGAAGLLGLWVYKRLEPSEPRHQLIMSALGHIVALGWALVGGSLSWLALLIGLMAALALAPIWIALIAPLYQAILRVPAGVQDTPPAEQPATRHAMHDPLQREITQRSAAIRSTLWRPQPGMIACGIAFGLALAAQYLLNQHTHPLPGALLYLAAAGVLIAGLGYDKRLPALPTPLTPSRAPGVPSPRLTEGEGRRALLDPTQRRWLLGIAGVTGVLNFTLSGHNLFSRLNVLMWIISVAAAVLALWEYTPGAWLQERHAEQRPNRIDAAGIHLGWWALLIIALIALGVFFRFYRLAELPAEMNSDHAEKLLDVQDILHGLTTIFFPRNTGREPWQFYWTVGLIRLFHLPADFQTLKIGSALVGSLMLPGLYVLGAEVFGPIGGAWVLLFGGVTSWSVITTRFGLRYPFMQMPVVWTLALLARAVRRTDGAGRNDFILMGLIWGIGFYGYQSYRAMAAALPAAFLSWYVLSARWRRPAHRDLWRNCAATLGVAGLVLVPLARFSLDYPELFWTRILTRVTGAEQAIQGTPMLIFADNMRRALLSFFWYGDEVWVAGIPNVPIIDPILGALIVCGLAALLVWSLRRQDALPAALIVAGVVMASPSAAAIAFPRENPSAIRLGGMIPSVMVICATLPVLVVHRLREWPGQRWLAAALAGLLAMAVVGVNWQRTFETYASSYCTRSLNASEVAQAIQGFIRTGGPPENAFYVAYPHWFDSRAIGVWLGDIYWPNTILDIQTVEQLPVQPGPRLYIVHPNDTKSLAYLQSKFPDGWSSPQLSQRCPGHDFIVFYAPMQ